VRWSDELYRIHGLAPGAAPVTFDSAIDRVHPDDRRRVLRGVRAALEHGTTFAYCARIVRPDGAVREIETTGEPTRDRTGHVVGLTAMCRDMTDERRREEQLQLYADVARNVQLGLSVWSVGEGAKEGDAVLLVFNPASEAIARMPLAPFVGKTLRETVPYTAGGKLEAIIAQVARDGQVHEAAVHTSRDPLHPHRALSFKAFPLPGRCVGVAIEDITEQTRTRRMQADEQRLFEMIAESAPLRATLNALAVAIERQAPPALASILLLDPTGRIARTGASPSLPESYVRGIVGAPIGPKAGSCGTAAFRRSAVVVEDIETDPLWDDYRDLAREAGLRACWSTPIFGSDDRVLGTFALHYREPRTPRASELALIARATHIARIAIERRQLIDELRALSGHIESAREEERTGIAREIHDELGQSLTAIKMDLAWIGRRVAAPGDVDRGALIERVRALTSMTDDVIDQVRRISSDLRPGVLDDLGLVPALEWQAQEFERRTGLTCVVRTNVSDDHPFDRALSTAVFRIFQEALTNVVRHAEASAVDVHLETDGPWLRLEVSDDGKGIAADAMNPGSLGLLGIRERARRLGGTAKVSAAPSGGTIVSMRVPLSEGEGD
jgi:PAS domain S-box-containing protein